MTKVALISLGCAKNLVDSEVMLGVLKKAGYVPEPRSEAADVIIVNTCGFIEPARSEAERVLRGVLRLKRRDPRKRIVVAGCYVERDRARLETSFPGVDAWTGVASFDRIVETIEGRKFEPPGRRAFLYSDITPRLVSTPGTWAYIKISEGCSHRCAFCSIPLIKGPYVSRSLASVVREARLLASLGVKEVNLISQDTTFYGRDRGLRHGLVKLVERLDAVAGLEWIRFLYGYPQEVTDNLLEAMAGPKVCRYLDVPFQHADRRILKAMKRGWHAERTLRFLDKVRSRLPGVAVRTSLIVGFPGEGRPEFARLKAFVRAARFDHLGVFTYSPERDTPAAALRETVTPAEKSRRKSEIMAVQAEISRAKNTSYVGTVQPVLIEGPGGRRPREWRGRARFQAPEVDGIVRVAGSSPLLPPGVSIVEARIVSAGTYDLRATVVT